MNKDLIYKTINIIDRLKLDSIVEITKDEKTNRYQLKISEYSHDEYELLCLTEEDAIWNDGETIEDIKKDLVCCAVKGCFQDINIISV